MNDLSLMDWRNQFVSFRVTDRVARELTRRDIWLTEQAAPDTWFNPSYLVGSSCQLRTQPMGERSRQEDWVRHCDARGIVPVVVAWPQENLAEIPCPKEAQLTYLEPTGDQDWLDEGWLLRRMATPDAPVLRDWHKRRQGFLSERIALTESFGTSDTAAYANAFGRWFALNDALNHHGLPWDEAWHDWDHRRGQLTLSPDNVTYRLDTSAVHLVVKDAPYLQATLPIEILTPGIRPEVGTFGDWIQLDPELLASIRDLRRVREMSSNFVPRTIPLYEDLEQEFRNKGQVLAMQRSAVGLPLKEISLDSLGKEVGVDLEGHAIEITCTASADPESREITGDVSLFADWTAPIDAEAPPFAIELTLLLEEDDSVSELTASLAPGRTCDLGTTPVRSGVRMKAQLRLTEK